MLLEGQVDSAQGLVDIQERLISRVLEIFPIGHKIAPKRTRSENSDLRDLFGKQAPGLD